MPKHSTDDLVKRGHAAMTSFNPELAVEFYGRALEQDTTNCDVMDSLADALLQIGDHENALPLLQRSIAIEPAGSPYKHIYLGQMLVDREALDSYERAIALLIRDYAAAQENIADTMSMDVDEPIPVELNKRSNPSLLKKQLAKAYCNVADLFLTDLAEDEGAEHACQEALLKAHNVDPTCLDVQQTLASLRLSQCKPAEACDIMSAVCSRVIRALQMSQQETIMGTLQKGAAKGQTQAQALAQAQTVFGGAAAAGAAAGMPEEECPEHHFCMATAKLVVECCETRPSMSDEAMELLALLLEEDDENTELWYIMGVAALSAKPADIETASFHLNKAKSMVMDEQERTGEDCSDQLCMIDEKLTEVTKLRANSEIAAEGEEDEEAED